MLRRFLTGGVALAVLALFGSASALAQVTSADQVCAAAADPCVVSTTVQVADGASLDFGNRTLQIQSNGTLAVGPGVMTLSMGTLQVNSGGKITAIDSASGGIINIDATGGVNISGTIDASGDVAGSVAISAAGSFQLTSGTIRAKGDVGEIDIDAADASILGNIDASGASEQTGGDITITVAGPVTVAQTITVSSGTDADAGDLEIDSGSNVLLNSSARLNADGSGFGFGGNITLSAGDPTLGDGSGNGALTLDSGSAFVISANGGSSADGAGDGGTFDISVGTACTFSSKMSANSGSPDGSGGGIDISCGESGIGSLTVKNQIAARGIGSDSSGGEVDLAGTDGVSIPSPGQIDVTGGSGGGGSAGVSATGNITIADRINASSISDGPGGSIDIFTTSPTTADLTLLASGRLNADGNGAGSSGGDISMFGCKVIENSGAQTTVSGDLGSISVTGVNQVDISGTLLADSNTGSIEFFFRDSLPFIQATASVQPPATQHFNFSLPGCGTPAPVYTLTVTPTEKVTETPTPTRTMAVRNTPTPTPSRTPTHTIPPTITPTPTQARPSPTPTISPTPQMCSGVLGPEDVIRTIFDRTGFLCMDADVNGDGAVNAADLTALVQSLAGS